MSAVGTAIVAALPEEIGPLAERLTARRRERRPGLACLRGRLAGREVVVASTGDGAAAAARGATAVLEEYRPQLLLGVGVAGGLSPDLPRGALVAAGEVRDAGGRGYAADPEMLRRALAGGRTVAGVLTASTRVVHEVAAKRRLWLAHDRCPRLAVDLESAAWARSATAAGVPWLVLRAISDAAGDELPLPFGRLSAATGGVSRPRVAAHLALRPWRLPATLELRRRVRRLAASLAELVLEVLA